ncbi:protein trichome birefringence-like 25 isoform X1 [Ziziphus jujuba]|uniref:Protein trichome birefringence-like 25 isoform X1 n=1 Tax=Ziziphus jujuba TaxID=326968 RepID=A0ABM3IUM7_ZIZJJ|nr:protein trichome birefringence-like 25 isoform X1 [Ziziphus jujuba]
MRFESNPLSSLHKQNHFLVKFAVSFLLMGLAFRIFFSDSIRLSSVLETTPLAEQKPEPPLAEPKTEDSLAEQKTVSSLPSSPTFDFPGNESQTSQNDAKKCDIFKGDWIPDPSGPRYTNESCHVMEAHQNCMKNGRPDSGYFYWRWSPRDCDLPKFNPQSFLDMMRNKSMAFIGDSISRNHVQSLLCILSQVEQADEVYHDKEYRSKRWHFLSHNFTLSVIWSPFLIKAAIFEDMNGASSSEIQLYLDKLDNLWTDQFNKFDYAVIAGGKWFLKTAIYHENGTITGCHYCPGKNITELGYEYAYRKAVELVLNFITGSEHKPMVLFRTTTPDHFENGEWFSGGYCNRTVPFREGEVNMKDVDGVMRNIELEEVEKAAGIGSEKGLMLKILDTTQLSLLRPDGHPGPYRQFQPFPKDQNAKVQNDCLHWCLPGPIDSWNDLVMELLVNGDKYR